ncbi:sterol O-acyltransferase 1 [Plodia interpunctella]|uniref:sterol O-acyltransferase 1 n=1 Tax=Plodia interpunctella TaxID=58824 RepID=UPI0023676619|nr:sterol O-acyltransferase 1 [Plodia interpunctella]XP_053625200.1 sterol O-acyltransferase 1 [Plodia interpunctella]
MTDNLRRRKKEPEKQNGTAKYGDEKTPDTEFALRESPLTLLLQSSPHVKVVYHIFVVILIILLLDTVVYDLVEKGKINIGLSVVKYGFGDIKRGFKLWLFTLTVTLAFYPGLRIYAGGQNYVRKLPALHRIWKYLGISGLVGLQGALLGVTIWDLGRTHLEIASSAAVTLEMFRLSMKIHGIAMACIPRLQNGRTPLPTLKNFIYYLFAPTFIYRDEYPRTKKIRWGLVVFHFLEVAGVVFYNSFLWERFILPYWSDYGKQTKVEAGMIVRGLFGCVLPGVISFLCGFYCVLHAWCNAFAEMMTFGDRLFYEEWWVTSQFSRYYRAWNRVVYSWLRCYIYRPLVPQAGRAVSTFVVFFISAMVHEVILALAFGFFYPVLLLEFGVFGLLFLPITAYAGKRFPNALNLFMWFTFFIGNGILWSLYPMEYFARKNCPPSDNDSFFIPKSWSCPEVVLKPNWTFQNPFDLIY